SRLAKHVEIAKTPRFSAHGRADERERMPTLHAEGDIVQNLHYGMAATTWIVKREMIDLENRIFLAVVGSGNSLGADPGILVQNIHPAKPWRHRPQDPGRRSL